MSSAGPESLLMSQQTAAPSESVSTSRRAWVRYRCAQPAQLHVPDSYRCQSVTVLDLSRGGVGLLLKTPVERGTLIHLELRDRDDTSYELTAEVKHVAQEGDGTWRCGCEFAWTLSEAELQVLLR
jgi:subtilisin-like proprotein convertase family protein